jgi:OmcA/MtrC family decaheme c-type cytochrome
MLRKQIGLLLVAVATAALMMSGCSGSNGANGLNGKDGTNGTGPITISALPAAELAKLTMTGQVNGVTSNGAPVVSFKVTDQSNNPVIGLGVKNAAGTALNNMGFSIAKLVPATVDSPSKWVSYIVTTTAATPAGQKPSTDTDGTLIDNGDGTYQYTFKRDITLVEAQVAALTDSGNNRKADLGNVKYEPLLTHRLVVQIGGNILNTSPSIPFRNPLNLIYDFIPATGKVVTATDTQREIVTIAACNECHGKLAFHGGGVRVDTRYCVMCHNAQRAYGNPQLTSVAGAFPAITRDASGNITSASTYIADGEVSGNFLTMIHKIHMGNKLTKTNYNYAGVLFNEIVYPQDVGNCRKCHRAEASLQGDNWNTKPSRAACGACHDGVNFATGAGHSAGNIAQPNDANCASSCHNSDAVKGYHMGINKTINNPVTPAGFTNFTYDVASATAVNGTSVTVKFRILADGTPVSFVAAGAGVAAPLAGFTGSPSFLLAFAQPQDGVAAPADYTNFGAKSSTGTAIASGQPATVSIAALLNTTSNATVGSLSATADTNGYYTATITGPNYVFPVGATMRAVALQGYFTQVSPAGARHAVSVVKAVTGDAVRRVIVDPAKCGKCHEWFEGHGGNRVYETQVCVTCHNPNLSTSGRTITDAKLSAYSFTAIQIAILTAWDAGFNQATPGYSLSFSEFTNNFKELIHGIHAGKSRTTPLRNVRNGSGTSITLVDGNEITFPGILSDCASCHVTPPAGSNKQTWKANLAANVLPSTNVALDAGANNTAALKLASRLTVPNAQDLVNAPVTGACISCHDSAVAKAHMASNGAQLGVAATGPSFTDLGVPRTTILAEQCVLCHGEGRVADVVNVHAR